MCKGGGNLAVRVKFLLKGFAVFYFCIFFFLRFKNPRYDIEKEIGNDIKIGNDTVLQN